jgi:hypothetical protein
MCLQFNLCACGGPVVHLAVAVISWVVACRVSACGVRVWLRIALMRLRLMLVAVEALGVCSNAAGSVAVLRSPVGITHLGGHQSPCMIRPGVVVCG